MKIIIIPYCQLDEELAASLTDGLAGLFKGDISLAGSLPVPADAFDYRRGQLRTRAFFEDLRTWQARQGKSTAGEILLAVADADLFIPRMNFVFGEADRESRKAVVSLYRLRSGLDGCVADSRLFKERLLKEAVHECGHAAGLDHCDDYRCVMHYSHRIEDTDLKGPEFCQHCSDKLARSNQGS